MKRVGLVFAVIVCSFTVGACANISEQDTGWVTLLDGSNPSTLESWSRFGDA